MKQITDDLKKGDLVVGDLLIGVVVEEGYFSE